MFDTRLRRAYAPALAGPAVILHRAGVRAWTLTVAGLILGLGAAGAAATGRWWWALGLWLGSRLVDGMDGAVARIEGPTARGGVADLVADFTVYAAFVVGVAVARPEARLAATAALAAYYVSAAAFLTWSAATSAATATTAATTRATGATVGRERGLATGDERSVRFVGGLAEGAETVAAYSLICLLPHRAGPILWVFAALVAVTAVQRVVFALTDLTPERNLDRDLDRDGGR